MHPLSPSLPFYPHEFSGSAEPDFSSNQGDGKWWPRGFYFGTRLKDETPNSLHLSVTVNWRKWGHQHFGKQNQKSEWVEVIGPKWNERQERQCLKIWAAGEKGRQKVHSRAICRKKAHWRARGPESVTLTAEQGERRKISVLLHWRPLIRILWPQTKNYFFKNLTIIYWAVCLHQAQCWEMFA